MFDSQLVAFIGIAFIITITPGPDTLLVLKNSLTHGRPAGFATIWGIVGGTFVHATMSALGLSLILMQSARAYQVVKWAGAAYLIWLGIQSLRDCFRKGESSLTEAVQSDDSGQKSSRSGFFQGLLNNLLNPKVAIFYLAFLPQFIGPDDPVLAKSLLMAAIHGVEGILWLGAVAWFAGWARIWLSKESLRRAVSGVAGLALIGFGLRLAAEKRL